MTKPKYRPCVGVMLLNGAGLAFVGRRRPKGPHDFTNERFEWQMPQGGVDEGEAPVDAALRELYEETNVRSVEVLAEIEPWLSYDLPLESPAGGRANMSARRKNGSRCVSRARTVKSTSPVPPAAPMQPEFDEWRWERPSLLPETDRPVQADMSMSASCANLRI